MEDKSVISVQRKNIEALQERLGSDLSKRGAKTLRTYRSLPVLAVSANQDALDYLLASPDVVFIEEDLSYPPLLDDSTEIIGAKNTRQWGLRGAGQAIAILDTGVESQHSHLQDRVALEACFSQGSGTGQETLCPNGSYTQEGRGAGAPCSPAIDGCEHGTHVAGIAAGQRGVAPQAQILSVQVFTGELIRDVMNSTWLPLRVIAESDQIAALDWIAQHTQNSIGAPIRLPRSRRPVSSLRRSMHSASDAGAMKPPSTTCDH
jgi:subtilisin family serine protease